MSVLNMRSKSGSCFSQMYYSCSSVYLKTFLKIPQFIQRQMGKLNDELKRIWMEAVVTCLSLPKLLYHLKGQSKTTKISFNVGTMWTKEFNLESLE